MSLVLQDHRASDARAHYVFLRSLFLDLHETLAVVDSGQPP